MKNHFLPALGVVALLLAFLSAAAAAPADPAIDDRPYRCALGVGGKVLSAKAMNGSASSLTYTFGPKACGRRVASFRWLVLEAEYTHANSGNVVLTLTHGQRAATANKTPQVCTGSGTCVLVDAGIFSKAVTGDKKWSARLGLRGFPIWKIVGSHDGAPAGGDLLTIYVYLTD